MIVVQGLFLEVDPVGLPIYKSALLFDTSTQDTGPAGARSLAGERREERKGKNRKKKEGQK